MAELNWPELFQHEIVMGEYQTNQEVQVRHWKALSSSMIALTNVSLMGGEWKLSSGHNLEAETVLE